MKKFRNFEIKKKFSTEKKNKRGSYFLKKYTKIEKKLNLEIESTNAKLPRLLTFNKKQKIASETIKFEILVAKRAKF